MFAGEYHCKLDEKGRFILPGLMRERLEAEGKSVVFIKGPEHALWLYSLAEWQKVLERTRTVLDEDQCRLFMHFVVAEASTSDVDKAGRVLIPGRLRKLIAVDDDQEVTLVGLYTHIEVWNPAEWRRYLSRSQEQYEQNIGKILNLL
jgi:MraZ protein